METKLERAKHLIGKTITSCTVTEQGRVILFFEDGTAAVFRELAPSEQKELKIIHDETSEKVMVAVAQHQKEGWEGTQLIYDKKSLHYYAILEKQGIEK